MKILISVCLILCFCLTSFAKWGNGPKAPSPLEPTFGGHDWIAWKAYLIAKNRMRVDFIGRNDLIFLYGTEAPDNGVFASLRAEGRYADRGKCHCVLFDDSGSVVNDRAAVRVKEEFDKAKEALRRGDQKMAAFYVGAMAHYLGDLGQFMHLIGKRSRWENLKDKPIHGTYEGVVDRLLKVRERESSFLEEYIARKNVSGSDSREITIALARFSDTGGGTRHNVKWMFDEYTGYGAQRGKRTDPQKWGSEFRDQTGANVNEAVNAIAKLIVILAE